MAKLFPAVSWAPGCNIYEVNIRQYTEQGTFDAFRPHLNRLDEMGIDVIWLMPITPISLEKRQGILGSYYACSSYTKINPEFGTLADLKELVNDAHSKGIKVLIDWVANHTGWDHHWKSEHPEWYHKDEQGSFFDKNGWIDVIDLNYSNTAMRQEMIMAMKYWVAECDIDGFRCDMAHLIPLDFWVEARSACDEVKPLFWLAETDNTDYHDVFDASYAWSWMHASEKYIRGEIDMVQFKQELQHLQNIPADSYKLMFTSNHDENSWNGTEFEKYGDAAKTMAVLCSTYKALFLIYSGQELPNRKRLKFFDKDQIDWQPDLQLYDFYKRLLQLRRMSKAVAYGEVEMLQTNLDNQVLVFLRKKGEDLVLVLLNLSNHEKLKLQLNNHQLKGEFQNWFSGLCYHFDQPLDFELNPWEYHIYVKQRGDDDMSK